MFKNSKLDNSVSDPRIEFFNQCQQNLDLALPILEKVIHKTLVLQNYSVT